MNPMKKMTDLLGVTMEELRGEGRTRRISDARTLLAATLPITQQQAAALLNCSQPAIHKMRKRHNDLLASDLFYKEKWNKLQNITTP